jgi:hypothetical protein
VPLASNGGVFSMFQHPEMMLIAKSVIISELFGRQKRRKFELVRDFILSRFRNPFNIRSANVKEVKRRANIRAIQQKAKNSFGPNDKQTFRTS